MPLLVGKKVTAGPHEPPARKVTMMSVFAMSDSCESCPAGKAVMHDLLLQTEREALSTYRKAQNAYA